MALVDELAIDVVFDDHEAVLGGDREEILPPLRGEGHTDRVVERRDRVQRGALADGAQLRERRPERAQLEAVLVERYAHDLDRVVVHDAERQVSGGRLDEHHVARRGEDGGGPTHEPDRQQRWVGLPEGELDDPFVEGVLRVRRNGGQRLMIRDDGRLRFAARAAR